MTKMPGKAYTMREMRQIVDYLVEHKAYEEIRGRKMWMDFANSKQLDRTWQSMKETFLKRILPDISNPYYKLTREQMSSFKQGYDIEKRNGNKLEVRSVSEESSNSTTENQRDNNERTGASKNEEKSSGENIQCSKIQPYNRSTSTETLVLENCYENADEIQRELESPKEDDIRSIKSLKDLITYSEPLTPMVQEVLDDFATDDEEPRLQIDEDDVVIPKINDERTLVRESISLRKNEEANVKESKNCNGDTSIKPTEDSNIKKGSAQNFGTSKIEGIEKNIEKNNNDTDNIIVIEDSENNTKIPENSRHENVESNSKNVSNNSLTTPDSLLPNNQEGLQNSSNADKRTSNEGSTVEIPESDDVEKKKNTRKALQLKTVEHRALRSNKPIVTETDSVITIQNNNNEEPIIIDSHSKDDSVKVTEVTEEPQKPEDKKTTTDKEIVIGNKTEQKDISKEGNETEQKIISKEHTSQEAGPSGLNKDLNDSSEINPCLKSVSLYAEQFSQSKYSDSECSEKEVMKLYKAKDKPIESKNEQRRNFDEKIDVDQVKPPAKSDNLVTIINGVDDVVLLKSHSDSDLSEDTTPPRNKKHPTGATKTGREKALANVFGFSSGAISRKRSVSYVGNSRWQTKRSRTMSRSHYNNNAADSNDSASDSDSAPPCCRTDRRNGKFLNPKSYDILTKAGGHGLFVIGRNKKMYEVLMNDKHSNNHLYVDESGDENADGFWQKKFFEEKLRAEELSRLLKNAQENQRRPSSPILQTRPSTSAVKHENVQKQSNENTKTEAKTSSGETKDKTNVKFKFTKDYELIQLECQLPDVNPDFLEKMAQMFNKHSVKAVESRTSSIECTRAGSKEEVNLDLVTVSSGKSTPVLMPADPETQERVNKMESEIFKEIEEKEKTDTSRLTSVDSNVNKRRRGRPRKDSSSSIKSNTTTTAKKAKTSSEGDGIAKKTEDTFVETPKAPEVDQPSEGLITSKRQTRTPKKFTSEPENKVENKSLTTRSSVTKQPEPVKAEVEIPDDSRVRYMFPKSPVISTRPNPRSRTGPKKNEAKPSTSYPTKTRRIYSSPDNSTTHSIESTQGYQDSDNSPTKMPLRKKRKRNVSSESSLTQRGKEQSLRRIRRKSYPYLADDDTFDDITSDKKAKLITTRNSSLDTEAYRSESYQLMIPKVRTPFKHLNKIDELRPVNETDGNFKTLSPLTVDVNEFHNPSKSNDSGQRIENSSSVSLPLSPELSVVENFSVSKDMISSEDIPSLNETQANDSTSQGAIKKYMISDVDVSVPLMEQDCEIRKSHKETSEVQMTKTTVSESLLNKICSVNIEEPSCTDSLDQKLGDMLLESAKKLSVRKQDSKTRKENMEVDATASEQKKRSKKRCSTPCKKKDTYKSKTPTIGPVVEEERIELCSRGGRRSCPPSINMVDFIDDDNLDITAETNNNKRKKKKDVIKVKILRPRDKNVSKEGKKKKSHGDTISVCTDSGINDTESGVFFLGNNDSVDLIHNHSETCIHANECIGDSIEFLDNTTKSILSVDDSREGKTTPDWFCNNAQEATSLNAVKSSQGIDNASTSTVYLSPLSSKSFNSLMTEDLSNEPPIQSQPRPSNSKWYLLSDQETTNTNFKETSSPDHNAGCFNANLKQIFPITCAVPNLSTITEMSRENDSRKSPLDVSGNGNEFRNSSQSIFD